MPRYTPRFQEKPKEEKVEDLQDEIEIEKPKKSKKKRKSVETVIQNHQQMYEFLKHIEDVMNLEFLKEIASQSLGQEPSNFFTDFDLPTLTSKNELFYPIQDLQYARNIEQVKNVILNEGKDKENDIFNALLYCLKQVVQILSQKKYSKQKYISQYGQGLINALQKV